MDEHDASAATFPAAPVPTGVRLAVRAGTALVALGVIWGAVTLTGTGLGSLFTALLAVCLAPVLWQVGMAPRAYTVAGPLITVHRRLLPDSDFTMRASPERLAAAIVRSGDAGSGGRTGDPLARLSRRRTFHALTDARKGIRIAVSRGGALVISPDDPEAFLRATSGGRFP
jgi:hypothetical protein